MPEQVFVQDRLVSTRFVAFDCDGVLLRSNAVKEAALAETFDDLTEAERAICLVEFRANFGRSRDWHFARFADLLKVPEADRETFAQDRMAAYRSRVIDGYRTAPVVPGAPDLCRKLEASGVNTCVITGGVAAEASAALSVKGFGSLADAVFGAPISKASHLRERLATHGVDPADAVYIGDSVSDLDACHETGVPFVYVRDNAISTFADMADHSRRIGFPAVWTAGLGGNDPLMPLIS